MLRRLERRGYVTRERAKGDEGEGQIRLIAAGGSLESRLGKVGAHIACRAALEPDDFARLRGELQAPRTRLTAPVAVEDR